MFYMNPNRKSSLSYVLFRLGFAACSACCAFSTPPGTVARDYTMVIKEAIAQYSLFMWSELPGS